MHCIPGANVSTFPQRADLLAALQEVKAKPQDLAKLTQLQTTQTLGRKKFLSGDFTVINNNLEEGVSQEAGRLPSCVRGGKKKKRKRPQEEEEETDEEEKQQQSDPTVVRLGVRKVLFCDMLHNGAVLAMCNVVF